jgi:hypothetical protein
MLESTAHLEYKQLKEASNFKAVHKIDIGAEVMALH